MDVSSLRLSLRPDTRPRNSKSTLADAISRINRDRGHFRHVTEKSLQAEITANAQDAECTEGDQVEGGEGSKSLEERQKEIFEARAELVQLISQAQNDALTALDFVSLVLSKPAPKVAEATMSPLLKQMVSSGTLSYDNVVPLKLSDVEEENAKLVVTGWSLQNLTFATDRLAESAARLEKEMDKEARYWKEILSVSEQDWSLCRMPREPHTIGVSYGFREASSIFGSRGLAAMRADPQGNITLDQGPLIRPKGLRVVTYQRKRITSQHEFRVPARSASPTIEERITRARDSLFDEDLFHTLCVEARSLLSAGVQVVDDVIEIPITGSQAQPFKSFNEHGIAISLQPLSNQPATDSHQDPLDPLQADLIASALRILLADAYRGKAAERMKPPPPIDGSKGKTSPPKILQPLMTIMSHHAVLKELHDCFALIGSVLSMGFGEKLGGSWHSERLTRTTASKQSPPLPMQRVISELTDSQEAVFHLTCPSRKILRLEVKTNLDAPIYGTNFTVSLGTEVDTKDESFDEENDLSSAHFTDLDDLRDHMLRLLANDIAAVLAATRPDLRYTHNSNVLVLDRETKGKPITIEIFLRWDRCLLLDTSNQNGKRGSVVVAVSTQRCSDETVLIGLSKFLDLQKGLEIT